MNLNKVGFFRLLNRLFSPGKKRIFLHIFLECEYTGELDSENRACGIGTAVRLSDPTEKWEGTFMNDKPHGLG